MSVDEADERLRYSLVPGRGRADLLEHRWRFTPDRLAAHLTRHDEVVPGFGGGFQLAGPYQRPRHVRLVGRHIARAVGQGNGRLIINMPPQVGKSELISRWTPTWAHHLTGGRARVLLGSYQSRYAAGWGKKTQETIRDYGDELLVDISASVAARDVWETTEGGGMRTGGVESAMTGLPGDIIIIDDPFKNFKEAHSPAVRQEVWDWFWAVPMTRIQPGSTVIILHTRWHEDDLTGRILRSESADRWTHVAIPAVCDDPDTDPLGRAMGESIWPERFNEAHYAAVAREQGPYRFAGMFQQRPAPLEGELFKRSNWQKADDCNWRNMLLVRRWDLASGEDEDADYTAGVLMGRTPSGEVYILDVQHERLSPKGVEQLIQETARSDADMYDRRVKIRIEQEPGSSGKSVALRYVKELLAGYPAEALRTTGDKFWNAQNLAAQQEIKNVTLVRRKVAEDRYVDPLWHAELIEEGAVFPNGANDDIIDAASKAFNDLVEMSLSRASVGMASPADEPPVGSGQQLPTGQFQRPVGGAGGVRHAAPRTRPPGA